MKCGWNKFSWLICVMSVAAVLSCKKTDSATSGTEGVTTVTLQLNWKAEPQFGGFYAANVVESYRVNGLKVEIREGGAGAPTIEMLGAGTVPFAIVSADEIPRARAQGNRIVALFAVYQTHPQGIMTRKSRGFAEIGDVFKNEGTLAMERGLPYSAFLEKKYGFEKLQVVPSPFGDLSSYLTDEKYAMQVFVTSEPLAAQKTGVEPQTFLIADSGFNPYATVLATSETYLNSNRDVVEKMVKAVAEGWRVYLEDPSATNRYMRSLNPTMDEQTFAESAAAQHGLIRTAETNQHGLGVMTRQRWETLIAQLVDLKVLDKPIPAEECFLELRK